MVGDGRGWSWSVMIVMVGNGHGFLAVQDEKYGVSAQYVLKQR